MSIKDFANVNLLFMNVSDLPIRCFSVEEYHRIGEAGIIDEDERVELIDGRIVEMAPIGSRHSGYVDFLNRQLNRQLFSMDETSIVRIQNPVILNDRTEPQPDIAIVKFKPGLYVDSHPRPDDILLIIEVAESSLEEDKLIKLPRYAASGIPEVWIFNLIDNVVEVYGQPLIPSNGVPGYGKRLERRLGEVFSPEAFPDMEVETSDLVNL